MLLPAYYRHWEPEYLGAEGYTYIDLETKKPSPRLSLANLHTRKLPATLS